MRDPSRAASLPAGIELAVGDLDDPDSVSKAVAGVKAIFLMQVGGGTEQAKTMIAAARDAAVPRMVLLSSAGARLLPLDDNPMGAALAAREQVLREPGLRLPREGAPLWGPAMTNLKNRASATS